MLKAACAALILALPAALGAGSALTAQEAFDRLLKAQDSQASLQCRVIREELPKDGGVANKVSGTLKVSAGGKAFLDIEQPSPQKAISDGKTLWVEMSDVKQVMKYDAAQLRHSGNFFLDLPSSLRHYAKASLKRLIPAGPGFDEKKTCALELMPKDPQSAGFDRMRVWVDTDEWVVLQVTLTLSGVDNRVRFEDIQVERDPKKALPDKIFKYKAPPGYQVFDLESMQ